MAGLALRSLELFKAAPEAAVLREVWIKRSEDEDHIPYEVRWHTHHSLAAFVETSCSTPLVVLSKGKAGFVVGFCRCSAYNGNTCWGAVEGVKNRLGVGPMIVSADTFIALVDTYKG